MLLIDKPLVSDFVKDSVREGRFDALDLGKLFENGDPVSLSEEEVLNAFKTDPGRRLHSISENAIGWIEEKLHFTHLPEKISLFKNKYLFRELTKDLFPKLFYRSLPLAELKAADPANFPYPLIIKPNVGFFSMGVHKLFSQEDWPAVMQKINRQVKEMKNVYPEAVLNTANFIVEACIGGEEFAVDAYYDEEGEVVILGMMKHLFGGDEDVSDRVYLTSAGIMKENLHRFDTLLKEIGRRAGLKNFSIHLELRVDDHGIATPIEVNPLRFGAWCTSADLMHYAYGFNPYEYYIKGLKPNWDEIIAAADGHTYSIVIFENSTPYRGSEIKSFDFNRILKGFGNPIELRRIDFSLYPIFGILFARTAPEEHEEIKNILFAKMEDYITIK